MIFPGTTLEKGQYSRSHRLPSYVNLPASRWCNTRQTEDRFWVSIVTWRRRQCVWRRSACTLCPASPSTTRTVTARLAARPKPQVGTATSHSPRVHLLNSPIPAPSGQMLPVISSFTLQPALPPYLGLSLPSCHLVPISHPKDRVNSINPKTLDGPRTCCSPQLWLLCWFDRRADLGPITLPTCNSCWTARLHRTMLIPHPSGFY